MIDEITELDVTDLAGWRVEITNGLRDRKHSEIERFIRMVEELFEKNVFSEFESVVKYLAIEMDNASVDCPNFGKYVGRLFANLYNSEYLKAIDLFGVFEKHYRDHSDCPKNTRLKRFNKLVAASVDELNELRCEEKYVRVIEKYGSH